MKLKKIVFSSLLTIFFSSLVLGQVAPTKTEEKKRDIYWPVNVIFTNSTNAAFSEPYNSEKKKITDATQNDYEKLQSQLDNKRTLLEGLLKSTKKNRKKIVILTKEIFTIKIEQESLRIEATRKIHEVDKKMIEDLNKNIEMWSKELLENDAKYKSYTDALNKE